MLTQWKYNKPTQVFKRKIWAGKKGISIVEILIVIAIIVIAFVALLGTVAYSLRISSLVEKENQANNLAQEVIEAVRNFRDGTDWDINGLGNLTLGAIYRLEKTIDVPPKWTLALGEETIDNFTRRVVFTEVRRDASDNIVESGGMIDLDSKKVTVRTNNPKDKRSNNNHN